MMMMGKQNVVIESMVEVMALIAMEQVRLTVHAVQCDVPIWNELW